jgi:ATP-dependent RNA helicase DeaD
MSELSTETSAGDSSAERDHDTTNVSGEAGEGGGPTRKRRRRRRRRKSGDGEGAATGEAGATASADEPRDDGAGDGGGSGSDGGSRRRGGGGGRGRGDRDDRGGRGGGGGGGRRGRDEELVLEGTDDEPVMPKRRTRNDITDSDIFDTDLTFADLGLSADVLEGIESMGYKHPTHVQAKLIPKALTGVDLLGQSRTGTGKTAAFGLPVLEMINEDDAFGGLVLCPTRELAIQITHELRELSRHTNLKIVAIYGGQRMRQQAPKLEKGPNIIVGTPGRIMDFHGRGLLPYDKVKLAVLDEVDRMLDIGFRDDIRRILGTMRHKHQTIFVSATISDEIEKLSHQYMTKPEKLVLAASSLTVSQVEQQIFHVERWDKNRLLVHLFETQNPEMAIVFCRTKSTVDGLTRYLNRKKIGAEAIHGDLQQGRRNRVMTQMREGEIQVMVASDLAARGIDLEGVTHVVNYDLPEDPEVYVHRIGRTARAGRDGMAWSFITPGQGPLLDQIERLTNVHIPEGDMAGFEPGPVPDAVAIDRIREQERRANLSSEESRSSLTAPVKDAPVDPSKFPGGIVPSAVPTRRMGGRLRTRRR